MVFVKKTCADGEVFEGSYVSGKRHGQGKMTCTYGEVREGRFFDGILQ